MDIVRSIFIRPLSKSYAIRCIKPYLPYQFNVLISFLKVVKFDYKSINKYVNKILLCFL